MGSWQPERLLGSLKGCSTGGLGGTYRLSCLRVSRTVLTSLSDSSRMRWGWRNSMAFLGTRWAPTPTAVAQARMKSATLSWLTPPEAISGTCGNGALSALIYGAPPSWEQGKILTKSTPAFHAIMTSVGVRAPGKMTTFCWSANRSEERRVG